MKTNRLKELVRAAILNLKFLAYLFADLIGACFIAVVVTDPFFNGANGVSNAFIIALWGMQSAAVTSSVTILPRMYRDLHPLRLSIELHSYITRLIKVGKPDPSSFSYVPEIISAKNAFLVEFLPVFILAGFGASIVFSLSSLDSTEPSFLAQYSMMMLVFGFAELGIMKLILVLIDTAPFRMKD